MNPSLTSTAPTTPGPSRRSVLGLGGVGAVTALGLSAGPLAVGAYAAEPAGFDELRRRWVDYLTGGSELDTTNPVIAERVAQISEAAATAVGSALPLTAGGNIWADLPMAGKEANIALTYRRIVDVATAWATRGTAQHADPAVAEALVAWYRHMTTSWYNAGSRPFGNWWFWEIGIPRSLGDLTALIDGLLTQADRDAAMAGVRRFTPNPNFRGTGTSLSETGGNRADKVLACLLRGIATRNAADMALARDALSDVVRAGRNSLFRYVTGGNGFYADGSYIDHGYIPYVGTYGNVALAGVASSLLLLTGSQWPVTDPNVSVFLDAPERSFAPFIWNGRMMETVRGRAVSREGERDFDDGFTAICSMLLLAQQIEDPYRTTYTTLAKGWLQRLTGDYMRRGSVGDLQRAFAVLEDGGVTAAAEPVGTEQFGAQERTVHRGTGWAFTVSTSSRRIGRYEWGNNENNLGWHHGDGVGYLYVDADPGQFSDDYWPTVDPYRIPGTTAALTERASGASGAGTGIPRAQNLWGGGVSLEGRWGSAGMDLTNSLGTTRAKKSWLMLDDLVLAVGSDIATSTDAETTVENRGFAVGTDVVVTVDGTRHDAATDHVDPRWAHVGGPHDVAGYVFVAPPSSRPTSRSRWSARTPWHTSCGSPSVASGSSSPTSSRPPTRASSPRPSRWQSSPAVTATPPPSPCLRRRRRR
ncbi:hyaluronate lyase [Knoellia remsis]|uniref:Hyaluronate lyase n=1 Tax=Knoellia remsis TaxID=407159 RepID=A0A2T0U9Y7_9MICO|nr:polysaccharide lyase 8 family protein [Knoellia remsis]PRY54678.1 hyaluronate lyase [Knoellia remsis]